MGKTSTTSKNKYNAKAYDQLPLRVPKGEKDKIKAYAESKSMSLNAYIYDLIKKDMQSVTKNEGR